MRTTYTLVWALALAAGTTGCASKQACTQCCCIPPAAATAATAVDAQTAGALTAALDDERRVQAYYNAVINKYGQVRPFSNIVHAEQRHEQVVTSLMQRHGVTVPARQAGDVRAVPETLRECSQVAAQLERENIAMYDRLLKDVQEPDIRAGFENLRAASLDNHLPAFERWAASDTGAVPAYGRGGGRGAAWGGRFACGGGGGVCRAAYGFNP